MKCSQILFDLILRQKALIWNSRSDQGEFKIKEITKKENDSVYFLKGARFTTSKI
jgi:hypothetical protein